jgi:hypothetical protein
MEYYIELIVVQFGRYISFHPDTGPRGAPINPIIIYMERDFELLFGNIR